MKFEITRTSHYAIQPSDTIDADDADSAERLTKPCDESYLELGPPMTREVLVQIDTGQKVLVKKQFHRYRFFIEVETLEDLLELSRRYGSLIVTSGVAGERPAVEIYDDYRE